jgi:hypothetical protein
MISARGDAGHAVLHRIISDRRPDKILTSILPTSDQSRRLFP